jgi:hypothetical protein
MKPLRLVNPRIPRHTAAETLDEIIAGIAPGVRRSKRRAAWRARIRRAREHSRWVTVPSLLAVFWLCFWIYLGLTGLLAAITASTTAVLVTGLLYGHERQLERDNRPTGPGGWAA